MKSLLLFIAALCGLLCLNAHAAGGLKVTIEPLSAVSDGAQWRVDGGTWRNSGATVKGLTNTTHTVEFKAVPGWITPASRLVAVANGTTTALAVPYVQPASLRITLTPDKARWRIYPAGTTPVETSNASGVTVAGLTPGAYTLDYEALPDYEAPSAETVILAAGQFADYERTYTFSGPAFTIIKGFSDAGQDATFIKGSDGLFYVATKTGGANGVGQIFRVARDGSDYTLLKAFSSIPNDGLSPNALIEGSDGSLYGTTSNGGLGSNTGTLFTLNKDGSGYTILHSFAVVSEGSSPNSLVEGSDGALYGTTSLGGSSNAGVLFKTNKDGSGFTVLRSMAKTSDGSSLRGLIEGPGGLLYGTAGSGGANSAGTVFKINKDGSGFTVLKALGGTAGSAPNARLLLGSDGLLYGTTTAGGAAGRGVVYCLSADGSGFVVLHDFIDIANDGVRLDAPLSEGPDGLLYGTTTSGGLLFRGTVFKMNKDGSGYMILKAFGGTVSDGGAPRHAIVVTDDGTLYGANSFSGGDSWGMMFRLEPDGSGFAKVMDFGAPDGALLLAPVTEGSDGALYGATYTGGGDASGTVFKVNKDGSGYAVLRRFVSTSDPRPFGRVIEASDGFLYGASSSRSGATPEGNLYRLNKDGSGYTHLHTFGYGSEGALPQGVIEASDGLLYGTTSAGGSSGNGTVFRINKDGSGLGLLHNFSGGTADGQYPSAAVTEAADGMLYGTTINGGAANCGTVFKISKNGTGYVVLHHFVGGATDGATPYAGVYAASDGRLYGTTTAGGSANYGTLFGLNADGTGYTLVKSFLNGTNDGATPYYIGVIEKNGMLWGTTSVGGAFSSGTLYRINPNGTGFEIMVNFGLDIHDGRIPASGVIEASDGCLYGTTAYGAGGGSVFRLRAQ